MLKFKLGELVWCILGGKAVQVRIVARFFEEMKFDDRNLRTKKEYYIKRIEPEFADQEYTSEMREEVLFATKEELLKSL